MKADRTIPSNLNNLKRQKIPYWLINIPDENISVIWRRHYFNEELQNSLSLCWALMAYQQRGIFIVSQLGFYGFGAGRLISRLK